MWNGSAAARSGSAQIRAEERRASDHLVVAHERVVAGGERIVAEVALPRRSVGLRRRGSEVALISERRVLGPCAAVEHADDHALPGLRVAAERRIQRGRTDELRARVGERLQERVLLDGDDVGYREHVSDPVGRHHAVTPPYTVRSDIPMRAPGAVTARSEVLRSAHLRIVVRATNVPHPPAHVQRTLEVPRRWHRKPSSRHPIDEHVSEPIAVRPIPLLGSATGVQDRQPRNG